MTSPAMQYLGLSLYDVAEAIVTVPMIYLAAQYAKDPSVILRAFVFTGLTATVFFAQHDFSRLRSALVVVGFAALGRIVSSNPFGFSFGGLFVTVRVAVAAGYILYYLSNVLDTYPIGGHDAAGLALLF